MVKTVYIRARHARKDFCLKWEYAKRAQFNTLIKREVT